MATTTPFFSAANPFLSSAHKYNPAKRLLICCKASPTPTLTKRSLSVCLFGSIVLSLSNSSANAAILEADENDELMEKVKRDRKKRIERQSALNSSSKEKGFLQDLIYKLSKVGEAIDKNDLSAASSVLGDSDWVQKANQAFSKLSSAPEEKTQVDAFNSSLASLISSVTKNDIESSRLAFVSSATAFEKWTNLTGLGAQLKGL